MTEDQGQRCIRKMEALGRPYTYRLKQRWWSWVLADVLGSTYFICYQDQPIREMNDNLTNVRDFVDLLNCAYQTGVADAMVGD